MPDYRATIRVPGPCFTLGLATTQRERPSSFEEPADQMARAGGCFYSSGNEPGVPGDPPQPIGTVATPHPLPQPCEPACLSGEIETIPSDERQASARRFEDLYRTNRPRLERYCRRRVPPSNVDDTVAEVFLVAWAKRDQFSKAEFPLAWLYAVAFRVISGQQRTVYRRQQLDQQLQPQPQLCYPTPEEQTIVQDEAKRVAVAILNRPSRDQQLMRLVIVADRSYDELARLTGTSRASIRSRLYRIRSELGRV